MTAPGAELLADPFPARQYASSTPSPGPGLASSRKKIDFPVSSTCWIPIGEKIPWLIALFKNRTFAGSIKILAIGSSLLSTKKPTPALIASFNDSTSGVTPFSVSSVRTAPRMPSEKLLTSISKPAGIFPSNSRSNFFITQAASGPTIIAPINIGMSEPTITPIVAIAPITPPLWP